jgi:hypothetical protein
MILGRIDRNHKRDRFGKSARDAGGKTAQFSSSRASLSACGVKARSDREVESDRIATAEIGKAGVMIAQLPKTTAAAF